MKMPDKIYLNKLMIRPGMLHPAQFPPDEKEEAYIRQDALLEWLEQVKSDPMIPMNIDKVIDYIKAL